MPDSYKNFAYSKVAVAPDPQSSGLSLTVTSGQGDRFPTPPFNATVWPLCGIPTLENAEIVRVTAKVGDVFTITREQESTSARAIGVGDQIVAGVTAKFLDDFIAGPGAAMATHEATYDHSLLTTFTESVQDTVGAMITAGNGMTISYNDPLGTVVVTNADRGSTAVTTHEGTYVHADIALNTAARHAAATILDSTTINFSITGQEISGAVIQSALDHGSIAGLADDDHTQYHTDARALTWLGTRSTSDLPEGTNQYYTDERVDDRAAALIQNGTKLAWTYSDVAGTLTGNVATGNLTELTSSVLTITGGTGNVLGDISIQVKAASGTQAGYLSAADWTTFNSKQAALGFTPENAANKGAAGGYAALDGGGKVPITQLPSSIMEYQGTWNATTNTPTLADGAGSGGDVYRVATGGTQNLGSGSITFDVGDYVIYNGTIWEKSDTTDAVASVNSMTGNVTLTTANISEVTNLYYTDVRARAAISESVTGLSYDSATGILSLTSGYVIPTTTEETNWNTAYGWGNHASAGYLTSVTAHNLLSATHGDTTAASVVRGDLVIGSGATPKWSRLAVGIAGTYLAGGTEPAWVTLNQAAVAGLTTASSPTFAGLALGSGSLTMTGSLGATGARLTKGWFADLQTTNAPIIDTLTAGRIVYVGASKELVDSANLLFNGTAQTITGVSAGASITSLNLLNTSAASGSGTTLWMGQASRAATISGIQAGNDNANWYDIVFSTSVAAAPAERARMNYNGIYQVWTPTANNYLNPNLTDKIITLGGDIDASNDLLLGPELHTDANAAADPNGTEANAITRWTNVTGTTTSVDSGDTAPHTGSYCLKVVSSGGASRVERVQTGLKIGAKYKISFWAKRGAQGTGQDFHSWVGLGGFKPGNVPVSSTTWTNYVFYQDATATSVTIRAYVQGSAGDILYLDDVSIKEVIGGNVIARGLFTGGGTNGLAISNYGDLTGSKSLNLASGTLMASPNWLYFDGNGDYATVSASKWEELNSATAFSWYTYTSFDDITATRYFLVKSVSSTNRLLVLYSSSQLRIYVNNGGSAYAYITLTGLIANSENHHIGIVYDGTQATDALRLLVYVDGVAQTISLSAGAGSVATSLGDLSTGAGYISNTVTSAHAGYMKDWRLYNTTVSAANTLAIYQGSSSVAGMVHRYKLNDGVATGGLLLDSGTNPEPAGLVGTATWVSKPYTGVGMEVPISALSLPVGTSINEGIRFNGNQIWLYPTSATALKTNAALTVAGLTNSALTAGRVPFAGTAGLLSDDADLTFSGDTLTATKVSTGTLLSTGVVRLKNYTVATLPAGTQGDTAFVTDALAPTFLVAVAGSGAVVTPVFYNGTNWVSY